MPSYKRLEKRLIESTTAAEAVRVPAYLALPGSLKVKQRATFTFNSHWG